MAVAEAVGSFLPSAAPSNPHSVRPGLHGAKISRHAIHGEAVHGWANGTREELRFWESWLKTKGSKWPEDYSRRLNRSTPFNFSSEVARTASPGQTHFVVLDVGSGPLSACGYALPLPTHELELIMAAPLAPFYDELLAKYNVIPPVRTRAIKGEDLTRNFAPNFFDMVYSVNALGHSENPLLVLRQMLTVVKPGYLIRITVWSNEAIFERYRGFHQWNIMCFRGRAILHRRGARDIDVRRHLGPEVASLTLNTK